MNSIYHELYKIIKSSLISHTIILDMPSENATISAYNGLYHTINKIIKDIQEVYSMKLEDYKDGPDCKTFCILRDNNVYHTNINIKTYIDKENKQIKFDFHFVTM